MHLAAHSPAEKVLFSISNVTFVTATKKTDRTKRVWVSVQVCVQVCSHQSIPLW